METIAQEAKRLVEGIPDDRWVTGTQEDNKGRRCLLGHLDVPSIFETRNISAFLVARVPEFLNKHIGRKFLTSEVNDGECPAYSQATPKLRSLALLDDMIAAGY